MRQTTLLFRDATGTFYNDRWKPAFEGSLNIILSIIFVKLFLSVGGAELGIVGVILATIITNLTICHFIEPYVLYKYAFQKSVKKHLLKNYFCVFIFIISLFLMDNLMQNIDNKWIELLLNGSISLVISAIAIIVTLIVDKSAYKNFKIKHK